MNWTRRDFLASAGIAVAASSLPPPDAPSPSRLLPYDWPAYLHGDPYLSAAAEPGLKGRSFEEARDLAFRLRTPAAERDRYVLGLPETLHA
ncbi:MAG: twin-arginine translocation signal domain-containing protein [Thermoanaerobaculia bacterium]